MLPGMQMPELWLYRTSPAPVGLSWLGKALPRGIRAGFLQNQLKNLPTLLNVKADVTLDGPHCFKPCAASGLGLALGM